MDYNLETKIRIDNQFQVRFNGYHKSAIIILTVNMMPAIEMSEITK